jgi:regulator of replication initiation timing
MHLNEGRMSRQLEMKFGVIENAINKLIGIVSSLTLENQKLQKRVEQLSRSQQGGAAPASDTKTDTHDDNYELDISQVQKILKQQTAPAASLGRRVINN